MIPVVVKVIRESNPRQWSVPSYSRKGLFHTVSEDPETRAKSCECEFFSFRDVVCRHIRRVLAFEAQLAEARQVLAS